MSIGMVAKQPFAVLTDIYKNSLDLEHMIKQVENYQNILDKAVEEKANEHKSENLHNSENSVSLFSTKTVETIKKIKDANLKNQEENER